MYWSSISAQNYTLDLALVAHFLIEAKKVLIQASQKHQILQFPKIFSLDMRLCVMPLLKQANILPSHRIKPTVVFKRKEGAE